MRLKEHVCLPQRRNAADVRLFYFLSSALTSIDFTALLRIRIFVPSRPVSIMTVSSLMLTTCPMMPPMVVISSPTASESHLRGLLLLLLLRAVHEEIEHRQHRHKHDNRGEPLHTGTRGRCRRICKNSKHLLILQIKIISYYYNPSMDIFQ